MPLNVKVLVPVPLKLNGVALPRLKVPVWAPVVMVTVDILPVLVLVVVKVPLMVSVPRAGRSCPKSPLGSPGVPLSKKLPSPIKKLPATVSVEVLSTVTLPVEPPVCAIELLPAVVTVPPFSMIRVPMP